MWSLDPSTIFRVLEGKLSRNAVGILREPLLFDPTKFMTCQLDLNITC